MQVLSDHVEVCSTNKGPLARLHKNAFLEGASGNAVFQGLIASMEPGADLILSFPGWEYWSSSTVAFLLSLRNKVRARGGQLLLCCLHDNLKNLLQRLKLQSLFPIFATEQEALGAP